MKKKLIKIGLALTAVMIALGLAGCPTGGGDDPVNREGQEGAELSWLNVDVGEGADLSAVWFERDGWATSADAVLADSFGGAVELQLASADASKKLVFGLPTVNDKATVEFAVKKGDALGGFSANPEGRTFENGDILVIKVTSENGANTRFYRANVSLGTNGNLASVTIGSTVRITDTWLGKPGKTAAEIEAGVFQTDPITTAAQFIALPQDSMATVGYALRDEATLATDLPATFTTLPADGVNWLGLGYTVTANTYLYIKVQPASPTAAPLYYKMQVVLPSSTTIKYGTPKLVDPDNPGKAFYIDPIWNNELWSFDISRVNMAESTEAYFKADPHTSAKAKALWDDEGIWVLVDVDFKRYNDNGMKDRPISLGGDYSNDSVEIFINERLEKIDPAATTQDIGNQFRVGTLNQRSGQEAPGSSLAPFNGATYAKTRTVMKGPGNVLVGTSEEAKNGGYMVIAHVPFKFTTSADAAAVFAGGQVIDNAQIGFELQLNTAVAAARDGILTWNGINTQAYQNAKGYGTVTLALDGRPRGTPPEAPVISAAALVDKQYAFGATADDLSVTVTPPSGGTLSYQWFKATGVTGDGTAVGTDSATYKPVIGNAAEIAYYYVVITNTVGAEKTSVVSPRRAVIEAVDPGTLAETWVINNPVLSAAGRALANADGSATASGGAGTTDPIISYKFPVGPTFTKVELVVEISDITGGEKAEAALKDGYLVTTPDYAGTGGASGQYPAWDAGTVTLTYNIGTGGLTSGAVSWQVKTWGNYSGSYTMKITKATFTLVDTPAAGPFYVNIADIDQRDAIDGFGNLAKATNKIDADGTPLTTLTFGTAGDSSNRARAVINLPKNVTAALGKGNAGTIADAWTLEICGETAAGISVYVAENATQQNNWNVFNGSSGTIDLTAPVAFALADNGAAEGKDATVIVLRVGNVTGTDTIDLKSIKFIHK